ncbi:MAG: hypothetical protein FJY67_12125 [Calditrichaeota bacterium]|nr:hypothetical protein [Calditrichota bacterium]
MARSNSLSCALLTLFALISLFAAPTGARAQEVYTVECRDINSNEPVAGILIGVFVKFGIGDDDWDFVQGETGADGKAQIETQPAHSTSTHWFAELLQAPQGHALPETWENPVTVYYSTSGRHLLMQLVPPQ